MKVPVLHQTIWDTTPIKTGTIRSGSGQAPVFLTPISGLNEQIEHILF
jgi:hypothetical protein